MTSPLRRISNRAMRSTLGFAANRMASSDRMMNVVYDLMNETNFAGIAEHEEMLNDRVRVDAYHRGIHRIVQPGDVVLDLGTGTGLLAFMASRAGAAKVFAVDHSDFIDVARDIGRHNGFTNIEFVQANSRDFAPNEPVDVVLHEQMGDELLNENMLANLLDVRDRVLRPGGRILPARFVLYIEPVSMHDEFRIRKIWHTLLPDGIDLSGLEHSAHAQRYLSAGPEQTWARAGSVASTGAVPEPIIEFDLHSLRSESDLPRRHHVERVIAHDMIIDGLCVWFEAVFDDETRLTTSPLAPLTSWGNRMFRVDSEVEAGATFAYDLNLEQLVDASTWTVDFGVVSA